MNKVEPAIIRQLIDTGMLNRSPITAHLRKTARNLQNNNFFNNHINISKYTHSYEVLLNQA